MVLLRFAPPGAGNAAYTHVVIELIICQTAASIVDRMEQLKQFKAQSRGHSIGRF